MRKQRAAGPFASRFPCAKRAENRQGRPTGTDLAILEEEIGCRAFPHPAPSGWGGARNRRDRQSGALGRKQALDTLAAAERAHALGLPFNRFITLHFGALGIADAGGAWATGRYLKLLGDHVRAQGKRTAWAYVRECDDGDGSKGPHVHILAHVPEGVNLAKMQRRWTRLLGGGPYRRGTVRTERIGGTAGSWRTAPERYRANLAAVLAYVLKGVSRGVARELGLERFEQGGKVIGKRAGQSLNLRRGPAWIGRLDGGGAPARQC